MAKIVGRLIQSKILLKKLHVVKWNKQCYVEVEEMVKTLAEK